MPFPPLTRAVLIATIRDTLEPLPFVHCLWEGGSTGFDRADRWSDVDLQCEVDDERVADIFASVEAALSRVAEISLCFKVPEPAWHGHSQRFYRFANAEPWLMLDFVVMKRGAAHKFNEPEVHGTCPVLFDRSGLFENPIRTDRAALETKLRDRIAMFRARVAMFQILIEKEGWRGQAIDALHFYQGLMLSALVELLRIKYDPLRHSWGNRYLHRTLPPAEAARLQSLMFVASPAEIPAKRAEAEAWFNALADELDARPRLVPPA
ncbi:MAG: hypothetical protein JSS11_15945 [Verrucomicrobia bacterium]|nr:hypothetical protein [Verrucomicrobiota bacterium]